MRTELLVQASKLDPNNIYVVLNKLIDEWQNG